MRVNMLKMCLNWKVLAGLGAVGAGVYAFAPGLSASAVSLLLLAVCPLSMVVMMAAMNSGRGEREAPADNAAAARATACRLRGPGDEATELAGTGTRRCRADVGTLPRPAGQPLLIPRS